MYYSFADRQSGQLVDLNEIDRPCCQIDGSTYSDVKYSNLYRALVCAIMENAFTCELSPDNTFRVTQAWDMTEEESRHMREATSVVYSRYAGDVWR